MAHSGRGGLGLGSGSSKPSSFMPAMGGSCVHYIRAGCIHVCRILSMVTHMNELLRMRTVTRGILVCLFVFFAAGGGMTGFARASSATAMSATVSKRTVLEDETDNASAVPPLLATADPDIDMDDSKARKAEKKRKRREQEAEAAATEAAAAAAAAAAALVTDDRPEETEEQRALRKRLKKEAKANRKLAEDAAAAELQAQQEAEAAAEARALEKAKKKAAKKEKHRE
jgi:hypothetical protein